MDTTRGPRDECVYKEAQGRMEGQQNRAHRTVRAMPCAARERHAHSEDAASEVTLSKKLDAFESAAAVFFLRRL